MFSKNRSSCKHVYNIWRLVPDARREQFLFTNILQAGTSGGFEHFQRFECLEMCSYMFNRKSLFGNGGIFFQVFQIFQT